MKTAFHNVITTSTSGFSALFAAVKSEKEHILLLILNMISPVSGKMRPGTPIGKKPPRKLPPGKLSPGNRPLGKIAPSGQ